jgi:thiol-disulfide isomerase/thioredoxin
MNLFTPALASLLLMSSITLAQDAPKPQTPETKAPEAKPADISPEATALDTASKDAIKKVRDISFKLTQQGGMARQTTSATVTFLLPEKRDRMNPLGIYKFVLPDDKGQPKTEWSFDGSTIFKIDHPAKRLFSMKIEKTSGFMPPMETWAVIPQWLIMGSQSMPGAKLTKATLGADAEIGGVKCRVLTRHEEITSPSQEEGQPDQKFIISNVWHIAPDDMLPRKVEIGFNGGGMSQTTTSTMIDMKVNAGLTAADFALKLPDGYTAEAGTYANMGLPDPADSQTPELKAEVGKPALAFKLKDPKGTEVSLESLRGRVVLLDFWATWCGPCVQAMPAIQRLHEKFADKPVTIIGMNTWEQKDETAVKFMEKKKYTYTLLLKADDLAKEYGISGIPTLILIGKDGNVLHTGVGFRPDEEAELATLIQKELDKK